jgi:hypothetical protein
MGGSVGHYASVITKGNRASGARVVDGRRKELGYLLARSAPLEEGVAHKTTRLTVIAEIAEYLRDSRSHRRIAERRAEILKARFVIGEGRLEIEALALLLGVNAVCP